MSYHFSGTRLTSILPLSENREMSSDVQKNLAKTQGAHLSFPTPRTPAFVCFRSSSVGSRLVLAVGFPIRCKRRYRGRTPRGGWRWFAIFHRAVRRTFFAAIPQAGVGLTRFTVDRPAEHTPRTGDSQDGVQSRSVYIFVYNVSTFLALSTWKSAPLAARYAL